MEEITEALSKAATSPDPAVRNMAMRYLEMKKEFGDYEAFFNVYRQGVGKNGAAAPVAAKAVITRERIIVPQRRPRERKTDEFSESIEKLVVAHGAPMQLGALHAAYLAQHPDDQTIIETFRQRLVKRRTTPDGTPLISLVPGRGYWWAAAALAEDAQLTEEAG